MPGPVFVEVPVDLLYPEDLVMEIFMNEAGVKGADDIGSKALGLFLKGYLYRQFHQPHLDLSRLLPGPYASMILGDLGAQVDKLEDPGGGDYLRNNFV